MMGTNSGMRTSGSVILSMLAWASACGWPEASGPEEVDLGSCTLEEWADIAVSSEDPLAVDAALSALRAAGPLGHQTLLSALPTVLAQLRAGERSDEGERLRTAIDHVSAQRDGHASGLYWHTDLDQARAEATRTGRPILSLRLLGRLDEEYSCANSRYFRLLLYSNPAVAARLSEQYVLHWSSERPAPVITIDMGDGRTLRRTITGNSAHYVLDASGRPVDVIIGLYSPRAFLTQLDHSQEMLARCEGADRENCLRSAHSDARIALETRWQQIRSTDGSIPSFEEALASLPQPSGVAAPTALQAMPFTQGKFAIEIPMVNLMGQEPASNVAPSEPDWNLVGRYFQFDGALDPASEALLRLKTGRGDVHDMSVALADVALRDGMRNELLQHHPLHQWYALARPEVASFETLNEAVYRELMQTPIGDPWLGLRNENLYDAVEVDGSEW